jgi:hypothetical protein
MEGTIRMHSSRAMMASLAKIAIVVAFLSLDFLCLGFSIFKILNVPKVTKSFGEILIKLNF